MSVEQDSYYNVNQLTLSLVVLASVVGALLLSFILFILQLVAEGTRLRREALQARARRLRLKEDNQEVRAPELPDAKTHKKHFHTFLSQVWGTGTCMPRSNAWRLGLGALRLVGLLTACLTAATSHRPRSDAHR